MAACWCLLLLVPAAEAVIYDVFSGRPVPSHIPMMYSRFGFSEEIRRFFGIQPWCTMDLPECSPYESRRLDGSCNNLHYPQRGTSLTPFRRLLPPNHAVDGGLRTSITGEPLPNARTLRVSLMSDGRVHGKRFTQLITYMGVVITGDVSSVHDTVNYVIFMTSCCLPAGQQIPSCMPIYVPPNDLHLRSSSTLCLNLTRAVTYQDIGCASPVLPPERINISPPMLELSIMYGNYRDSVQQTRQWTGGLLRSDLYNGKEWPPGGGYVCILNQPPEETYCFNGGNTGMNALMGINLITLWHYRNHNQIARSLQLLNPCWGDERLFQVARDINIAQYQHIIYYDLMPTILGSEVLLKNGVIYNTYAHVDDYDDSLEPGVTIEYVVGTRWFHTMQEGRLQLFDNKGRLFDQVSMVDYLVRTGALRNNTFMAGVTQGAFRQPTAENDLLYDPEIGERVLGPLLAVSDVAASDIMKGRDAGLPSYNQYRRHCGLPAAKTFQDLYHWMPKDQVDVMARTYNSVEDIDLTAAISVEKPMPGAVMGPTLVCIIVDQLLWWRKADRFWYENSIHPGAFTPDQLYEIRKMSMARLLCDHGDSVDSIQPYAFLLPGHGNEIINCSSIPRPNLEAWCDQSCLFTNVPMTIRPADFSETKGK